MLLTGYTELHRAYNNVVRKVAADTGAPMLDLERDFFELRPVRVQKVFSSDGIHFTREGLRLVGRRIARFLEENDLVPGTTADSDRS